MASEDGPDRQFVHEGRTYDIWVLKDGKSKRTIAAIEDGKVLGGAIRIKVDRVDPNRSERVSSKIIQACIDDLEARIRSGALLAPAPQ